MTLIKRLQSIFKRPTNSEGGVGVVARRFLQVFQAHGIEPAQIQRLLPEITLDSLQSQEKLLAALTHSVLNRTAEMFGIRLMWLEGVDDQIYEHRGCYKQPQILLDDLQEVVRRRDVGVDFPLRIITTRMNLDYRDDSRQELVPVIVEKFAELDEFAVYRYRIYMDGFSWDYLPTRLELKAIARIVFNQLRKPVPLFQASAKEVDGLLEGKIFPGAFVGGCLITDPSLEDYALTHDESVQAKEEDELPAVLRYIEEQQLESFKFYTADDAANVSPSSRQLPPLDFDSKKLMSPNPIQGVTKRPHDWIAQAHKIADELRGIDAACGAHDSLTGLAVRIAETMRKRKIYGPRGGPLSDKTILREALQGGKWKPKH